VRLASTLDMLVVLARSLSAARPDEVLLDAFDLVLAGIGCTRGIAYRTAGGVLEIVGERGLSRPLRGSLDQLPIVGPPWFAAQRAAAERRVVVDRDPAASMRSTLDRAAVVFAQWAYLVACPIVERDVHGVLVFAWPEEHPPPRASLAAAEVACALIAARLSRRGDEPQAAAQPDTPPLARPLRPPPRSVDPNAQTQPDSRPSPLFCRTDDDGAPSSKPALRERVLASAARTAAATLRREGPKPGAAVGAMLREFGLSQHEALSVLSFALSKGILVRDPPPSTVLRAPDPWSRTVLVADDDVDLRETLRGVLEEEGYAVDTAGNGREAMGRLLGRRPPRVLVLDLMMPVMDGWQILDELAKNDALSRMPVVIISAGSPRLDQVRAPRVYEFMRKPLDFNRLLTTIDRSMRAPAGAA
jgi:CheY-like chemotaxis protein